MSKFKFGDKVRILSGRKIHDYICGWYSTMATCVGDVDTICESCSNKGRVGYRLKEHSYWWDERGLELVEDKPSESNWCVIITPNSDTTTVGRLYCGSKLVKEVTTKKHPDDKYSRDEAIRVICERLVDKITEESPKYYNGKMVCVNHGGFDTLYTVGKIYTVVDGRFKTDVDDMMPGVTERITSFADWNNQSGAQWIEVVGE